MENIYMPFKSKILNIKKHTETDYTFRMEFARRGKAWSIF